MGKRHRYSVEGDDSKRYKSASSDAAFRPTAFRPFTFKVMDDVSDGETNMIDADKCLEASRLLCSRDATIDTRRTISPGE